MSHTTLTPVFVGLRTGLHLLFAALLALVVVRAVVVQGDTTWLTLLVAAGFGVLYLLGARIPSLPDGRRRAVTAAWVCGLTALWMVLLVLEPEAAYLVFPLFFLYLHVLPRGAGPAAVLVATAIAVLALGLHGGFSVGGVVGPLVGTGVALLIGLGYRALAQEAAEREALVAELIGTRDRLAAAEREQGVLTERARLAREIHDTVAQDLSSIQMLLHAAEAAAPERPGVEHIRLARATAAEGLADTRRFIRELAPPTLDRGLDAALRRLGEQWDRDDLRVRVTVPDEGPALPMDEQTALLRIAQGAMANVAQHARASTVDIELTTGPRGTTLTIRDDGVGFEPDTVRSRADGNDSFGLRAITERVDQLDGELVIDSRPGAGSTIAVRLRAVGS